MEEVLYPTLVSNEPEPLVDQESCDGAGWHSPKTSVPNPQGYPKGTLPVSGRLRSTSGREPVECWRALLQRLAVGRALDRLRRRCRRQAREAAVDWEAFPTDAPAPLENAEANELLERVREAVSQLPPRQSEVFCLHCLEGWTYQEISRHLQAPVDTIGVLLLRARQKLRELLPAISS